MSDINIWDFLGGLVVGAVIAGVWMFYRINALVDKITQELEDMDDQLPDAVIHVSVEADNNMLYCYSREDKQFICQGRTLKDIEQAFLSRFPDKLCVISEGDQELLKQLHAENENKSSL